MVQLALLSMMIYHLEMMIFRDPWLVCSSSLHCNHFTNCIYYAHQKISKGNLTITMYYVDLNIGQELYNMLQYTSSQPINTTYDGNNISSTYQPVVSLVMHPAVGGFPSAWEFTLIIVVALLAISFLASGNCCCYSFIFRSYYYKWSLVY